MTAAHLCVHDIFLSLSTACDCCGTLSMVFCFFHISAVVRNFYIFLDVKCHICGFFCLVLILCTATQQVCCILILIVFRQYNVAMVGNLWVFRYFPCGINFACQCSECYFCRVNVFSAYYRCTFLMVSSLNALERCLKHRTGRHETDSCWSGKLHIWLSVSLACIFQSCILVDTMSWC